MTAGRACIEQTFRMPGSFWADHISLLACPDCEGRLELAEANLHMCSMWTLMAVRTGFSRICSGTERAHAVLRCSVLAGLWRE